MIIEINPAKRFAGIEKSRLRELCGILPLWVADTPEDEDLKDSLTQFYGFGTLAQITGGAICPEGFYSYPGDPDLSPLMSIERKQEVVFIYEYGIVAICYNDGRPDFVTMMD